MTLTVRYIDRPSETFENVKSTLLSPRGDEMTVDSLIIYFMYPTDPTRVIPLAVIFSVTTTD